MNEANKMSFFDNLDDECDFVNGLESLLEDEEESGENDCDYKNQIKKLTDDIDMWSSMVEIHDDCEIVGLCGKLIAYVNMYQKYADEIKLKFNTLKILNTSMKKQRRPGDVAKRKSTLIELEYDVIIMRNIDTHYLKIQPHVIRYWRSCRKLQEIRNELLEQIRGIDGKYIDAEFRERINVLEKNRKSRLLINNINFSDIGNKKMMKLFEKTINFLAIVNITVQPLIHNGDELFGKFNREDFTQMMNEYKREIVGCGCHCNCHDSENNSEKKTDLEIDLETDLEIDLEIDLEGGVIKQKIKIKKGKNVNSRNGNGNRNRNKK